MRPFVGESGAGAIWRSAVLAVLASLVGGCATSTMWANVDADLGQPCVVAVVLPKAAEPPQVVVWYRPVLKSAPIWSGSWSSEQKYYALAPLSTGAPPRPADLTWLSEAEHEELKRSSRYYGEYWQPESLWHMRDEPSGAAEIRVLVWKGGGTTLPATPTTKPDELYETILPATWPRPAADKDRERARAVALTLPLIAIDAAGVVVIPPFYVVAVIGISTGAWSR